MMSNETGVVLGRLGPAFLRDLVLNYKGGNQETLEQLMDWYDEAVELTHEDDELAQLGLWVSRPLIVIGKKRKEGS